MSATTDTVVAAQRRGTALRPAVGGFPYLAEALKQGGVVRYYFDVHSRTSVFVTATGSALQAGGSVAGGGLVDVPAYDETAVVAAIRTNQAGRSTFPEFVDSIWQAGVMRYEVDLGARVCTYIAPGGGQYRELYPAVVLPTTE